MADKSGTLKKRIETLEHAKAQISKGYLEIEREKTYFRSALENLAIGFMMIDDYKQITFKNITVDEILGPIDHGGWNVEKLQELFKGKYDLMKDIDNCFRERIRIGPKDVSVNGKKIRVFVSPVNIFKKSLTVPAVVILLENITGDDSSWVNK
ncbi:hypothetical protein A3J17_00410 [Candidatus Curtissbacteria bacterium RIFCSPLOWO2_02_FULL_40_11]|uniref:PAS domain-containing protein n=2 Tax=Candidatus Curtissiibacteriota TaxID=1752717 RepID=A0A1F5G9P5_9BACT|nr:MAG: hypothetical protein A3D04_01015 [Candidatus Curtissbacteria bacterium RIFCSPHIGHO2_02_FULL_40_16b]OGD90438.1 MAG: hypothetical protein A3E11_01120 [Candidatus Curtissbacteria bacterium RIFCSPHIGHO2_12_FULL_38_37]OGE01521.1 MAG: hypothetical protein A3J17_00410 [Candidatus Curtissbacteria bacterium RIFCSPLOWO2_02_FULL_40_11]OGE13855.1 MAG: hypothetical protein A3G14_01755 [Candidatus Curtissbacteria bacterium RIFCSPLOWO2_12_FULL_38_9]